MICIQPCDKYYPDIYIINSIPEYRRAMRYVEINKIIHKIKIDTSTEINISDTEINFTKHKHFHRDSDQPAVIYSSELQKYYKNGKLHRDGDKPAMIYPNGSKFYFKNGKLHRDGDKPAVIYPNGTKYYYKYGKLHRDGNKPAIIYPNGEKQYFKNGKLHRNRNIIGHSIFKWIQGVLRKWKIY